MQWCEGWLFRCFRSKSGSAFKKLSCWDTCTIIIRNNCKFLPRKVGCLSGSALQCQNEKQGARTGTWAPLFEVASTLLRYISLFSGYDQRKFSSSCNSLRGMICPSLPPRHNLYKQAHTPRPHQAPNFICIGYLGLSWPAIAHNASFRQNGSFPRRWVHAQLWRVLHLG